MIIAVQFLASDSQDTETANSKVLHIFLRPLLQLLGLVARAKLDDDTRHTLCNTLEFAARLFTLSRLIDGVEQFEVEHLDSGTSTGYIFERLNDGNVDGVLIPRMGGVSGNE